MRLTRLGDHLELTRTKVTPDPLESHLHLGVRSFGRGMMEYGPTLGAELSKVSYYRLPENALVVSNIKAWEGAVTVSETRHERFIATQRLLSYAARATQDTDVRFVYHYLLSDAGIRSLGRASPGSADRNRTLGRKAFEEILIPLPEIDEQRAIAARLDAIYDIAQRSTARAASAELGATALAHGLFLDQHERVPLKEFLTEMSRFEAIDPSEGYRTAGVKWYAEGVFSRESKPGSEIKATKLNRLVPDEFIYNRLFAWKGSFALTPDQPLYASNEFPTFAVDRDQILPEYLLGWFSLPRVWDEVARLSTGATPTSRNRLKQEQLLKLAIPLPSVPDQQRAVDAIRSLGQLRGRNAARLQIAKALPQAARNAEFARLMS